MSGSKEFGTRKNKESRLTEIITGTIIRDPAGRILLLQSPKWKDKWTIPGGHLNPGEKIEDCALREGREETGLNLRLIDHVTTLTFVPKDYHRFVRFNSHIYLMETDDPNMVTLNGEATRYQWMRPEIVLELYRASKLKLAGEMAKAIKAYIDYTQMHNVN